MASCSQVSSLVQAYIDGELGHAEKSILEQHLRECGPCRDELREQSACAALIFESLAPVRLQWGLRSRVLDHLPEMDPALNQGSHPTDPQLARRRQRAPIPRLAIGLAAVFLLCVAILAYTNGREPLATQPAMGMVTFSEHKGVVSKVENDKTFRTAALKSLVTPEEQFKTPKEGRLAISLIGGSTLKANYNSSLTVHDNRRITVHQGLAFFDVGTDKRLFNVATPDGEIVVFGTAFVVDVTANATTVTVSKGDILVSNNVGKSGVSKGNQLVFRKNEPLAKPYPVTVSDVLAWADAIVPDPDAFALFLQTLELRMTMPSLISAVPVYVARVPMGGEIGAVQLTWTPDGRTAGHCGYILHVADSNGNLLYIDRLSGSLFNDPSRREMTLSLPGGPISGIDVYHIKLIPDHTDGSVESEMRVGLVEGHDFPEQVMMD